MNEYIIDKLENLGIRNLAKRVIENEDKILDLEEEIERLNNIINELYALVGKQLLSNTNLTNYTDEKCLNDIYDKLKELKDNQ